MNVAAPAIPGVEGAILSIFQDPVAAICFARQMEREHGPGTATNLHDAALRQITHKDSNKDQPTNVRNWK